MVNSKYNAESAESIAKMIVAYGEMRGAIGSVTEVITDVGFCQNGRATHEAEIERRVTLAREVFKDTYLPSVPQDIRDKVPLSGNKYMKQFEKEFQEDKL